MVTDRKPSEQEGAWRILKRYLLTGALVLAPIALTVYLLWKTFLFLDGILATFTNLLLRDVLGISILGERPIPGLGLIALLVLLTLTGYASRNLFGQWLLNQGRQILDSIPLVNRIYKTIDQISQAIFTGKREVFKHAVLIEYPRKGIYSIAIMTADTGGKVQASLPEDTISVFLPSTPNPTTGFLLFVPEKDVIRLDIPVEEAMKLIMSGGAYAAYEETPPRLK